MSGDSVDQQKMNGTASVASAAIDLSSSSSSPCSTAPQDRQKMIDVPDVFSQLLNVQYQPQDGILAYECVLKRAQECLRNCNVNKKQLLLSVIPVPENASNQAIGNTFRVTTGLTKVDPSEKSIFLRNILDVKSVKTDRTTNKRDVSSSKQGSSCNKTVTNFKVSLSEGFPFRGFSETEISMIQDNNAKHADSTNHQLSNNNPRSWLLGKGNKCPTSFYQQYLDNKRCRDSAKIHTTESRPPTSSSPEDAACSLKTRDSDKGAIDRSSAGRNKIPRRQSEKSQQSEKRIIQGIDAFDRDERSGVSQIIIDIRQNAIIKEIIRGDASCQAMDVCSDGEQNVVVDADDLLAITRDRLKASFKNFLKRAQEGTFLEVSAFPRVTKRRPETPREALEKDCAPDVSNGEKHPLPKQQEASINQEEGQRANPPNEKAIDHVTRLQVKCNDSQELGGAIELQKDNPESTAAERKRAGAEKFASNRATASRPHDVSRNPERDLQARSMSELAAYKKRYYDTLLNIQRAKVAVTNSLACSSDRLAACNDPYYANYVCQQEHHLYHRQRHHLAAARPAQLPAQCPTALAGLSRSTRGNQYSWTRPDCKYLLLKQLRLQRQPAEPLYTHDQDGWIHSYSIGPVYPCPILNGSSPRTRHCVRRKNLENLVGKLKETERSGVDN